MRKRRSDSPWNKLTEEQKEQMDCWFFDENLGHQEILERAEKEFGVKASQQTLTAYFRHRERMLNVPDGIRELEPEEESALDTRLGAGMDLSTLEAKTLRFASMAAYEMSLADPEKMQVKEIQSLMKMVIEHRRLLMDHRTQQEKTELQYAKLAAKMRHDEAKVQSKEEFEAMLMQTADILDRAKQRRADGGDATEAEKMQREAENPGGGQAEWQTGAEEEAALAGGGENAAAEAAKADNGKSVPGVEPNANEGEVDI